MEFSGVILDSYTNVALPGATVVGIDSNGNTTNEGTVSDSNGNYDLVVSDADMGIQVSYIGYQIKRISAADDDSTIYLDPSVNQLQEVTITAPAPNPSPITAGPVQTLKKTWIPLLIIFAFAFLVSESQEWSTKRRGK